VGGVGAGAPPARSRPAAVTTSSIPGRAAGRPSRLRRGGPETRRVPPRRVSLTRRRRPLPGGVDRDRPDLLTGAAARNGRTRFPSTSLPESAADRWFRAVPDESSQAAPR
jgi:hypothetical protein